MPATKQLRLSFPERQLLLPIVDPPDKCSQIGEDLVDVIDLNADEFIVWPPKERVDQFWDGDRWYKTDGLIAHDHDAEIDF